jgi:putative ABC transport system permease protein
MPRDLRFALRRLARTPAFAAAAVTCLALGIGANTAIFSVINAVLLRPLPHEEPERLVAVWEASQFRKSDRNTVSPANYLDWRSTSTSFTGMTAVYGAGANLTGAGQPEEVPVQHATVNLFEVLGLRAAIGRTFVAADDTPGGPDVALLSHGLWQRRFSADPSIVGGTIHLDGEPFTVIGVMPPWTESVGREPRPALWVPMRLDPAEDYRESSGRFMQVVGRLAPGVTLEGAQADLSTIAARLEAEHPDFNSGWSVNLVPLTEQVIGSVRRPLALLGGVVFLVLLIACGNVANLMLAQATARRREIAVHAALGVSALALGRRLLVESLLIAVAGGALGVLLAWWCTDALGALASGLPRTHEIGVDGAALAFTLVVSLAAGIGFGLVPALHAARGDLHEDLKEGGRASAGRGGRTRGLLIVAQVAGSLVLLVGAALLLKSFARLQEVELGFNPVNVLTARVSLGGERYAEEERQVRFFEELLGRVRALPGVRAVGAINWLPLSGQRSATRMIIEGEPPTAPGQEPGADVRAVDPGYFAAMEIPVVRGRAIEAGDRAGVPRSVVVSQSFAARYLAGRDPIGRRIHMEWDGDTLVSTVVGLAGDVRHTGVDSAVSPTVYWALPQFPHSFMTLVIRTERGPERLANAVVAQVRALDPDQPVADLKTYDDWLGGAVARRRFTLLLLGGFAGLALVLTAIGLYGTTAYDVVQRTRELGIRSALGAGRADLLWDVLRHAVRVVAVGAAVGVVVALAVSRVLSSLLFEVSATDPGVFVAITLLLLVVGAAAGFLPARRATRVDPMVAIRAE